MPSRRAQGEGSLYKTYKPKLNNQIRWVAAITVSEPGGSQKRITLSARTKAEGLKNLEELRAQKKDGYYRSDKYTVVDQLHALFSEKQRVKAWRRGTLNVKEIHLRGWLKPKLGSLLLRDFTPIVARQVMAKIEAEAGHSTAKSCLSLLHSSCELAVAEEVISSNPCRGVKLAPREEKKKVLWTPDEHSRFDDVIQGLSEYPIFVTLRETGLRIGEVLALKWDNVSLEDLYVYVKQTLSMVNGTYVLGPPKTRKSERRRHIGEGLADVLSAHKDRQAEKLANKGFQVRGDTYVFTDEDGGHVNREALRHQLTEICKDAGINRITFHYFRHMASSALKKQGVDSLVIAEEMGHSNKSITEDIYIQNDNQQRREAAMSSSQLYGLESNKNG